MKKVMFLLLAFVFLYSCQETEFSNSDKTTSDYLPISIGNYWVYQQFIKNPDGTEEATQVFDSTYIKSDTIINEKRYFEFVTNGIYPESETRSSYSNSLRRDSSGCLVVLSLGNNNNPNPYVIFSEYNYTDTLYKGIFKSNMDTLYTITIRMEKIQQSLSLPIGNFEVLNAKQTVIGNPMFTFYSEPRYNNIYYAKKVGEVAYSRHYFNSPDDFLYKLIRYSINEN